MTRCIAEVSAPKMSFASVQSEAEFTAVLEAGVSAKKIPAQLMPAFLDLYNNYKSACKRPSKRPAVPAHQAPPCITMHAIVAPSCSHLSHQQGSREGTSWH